MSVRLLWCGGSSSCDAHGTAGDARRPELFAPLLRTAVRCNNARLERDGRRAGSAGGDPSESALLLAAARLGVDVVAAQRERDAAPQARVPLRPAPEADDDARRGAGRRALVPRQGRAARAARALHRDPHPGRRRGR